MLAAALHGPGDIRVTEMDTPRPAEGEAVLKVQATTLCGSDVRIFTGDKSGGDVWPIVLGHEVSGVVADVGRGVNNVAEGEQVGVVPWINCQRCQYCRRGYTNMCDSLRILGYQLHGGLAEFMRIPYEALYQDLLIRTSTRLSPTEYALAEPLACSVHGFKRSNVTIGETVLILGAGPIGLFHLQLSLRAGARRVVVSEPSESRRHVAQSLGAEVCDPTSDNVAQVVRDGNNGDGADCCIVCTGNPALVNDAIAATTKGGRINLFAGFGKNGEAVVDLNPIHYSRMDVIGNSGATRADYVTALQLIEDGQIATAEMLTHTFGVADAEKALRMTSSDAACKVAVRPDIPT